MKKRWIIIGIIIILAIFYLGFKYVYFSKTSVKLLDIEGNPIENAKIVVTYLCHIVVMGENDERIFGYRESTTNSEGIAKFNSLNKFFVINFPFMYKCVKYITADKEGYCNERFYSEEIPTSGNVWEQPCWIEYGGDSTVIWALSSKEVVLKLKKVKSYSKLDTGCKIFEEDCKKSSSFKEAVLSQNLLKCTEGCQYVDGNGINQFKENCDIISKKFYARAYVYECITEIAMAKKDSSICAEIYYTKESNEVFSNLRASSNNPEYDTKEFKRRCYTILAKELKDCDNPIFDEFDEEMHHYKDYCKFGVLQKSGKPSDCAIIQNNEIREQCEVYLS